MGHVSAKLWAVKVSPAKVSLRESGRGSEGKAGHTQSIERAAAVLRTVARFGSGARLADVVARTHLAKPTAHRILSGLVRAGLIEQERERRCYHLGPEAFILGAVAADHYSVHDLCQPALQRLAAVSHSTVFLSAVRGFEIVYLECASGSMPIKPELLQVGHRYPVGISSAGQAVLAAMDDATAKKILAANAKRFDEFYRAYTPARVQLLMERARIDGFAVNPGLVRPGLWGIGVVVRDAGGKPVGALSIAISGPISPERQKQLVLELKREARGISDQLGKTPNLLQRGPTVAY